MQKETYWQTYFDADTVARAAELRRSYRVASTGVQLHVDAFEQAAPDAPVIIFNHGGGGYARLFTPLALALHERGYTVLLPDQIGQGFSGGAWRDVAIDASLQNILDVAAWARARYAGPLLMAGGSLGGGLAYHAAAAGAPVDGVICHNLYEFGRAEDVLALSRFAWATAVAGLPALISRVTQALAALLPGLPLPYRLMGRFDRMVDRREADFYAKWRADQTPLRRVTLRYLASMFATKPAVPYAENRLPVLVINPVLDEMVDPTVTRRNYDRLGGPKSYAEIQFGHWALGESFVEAWIAAVETAVAAWLPRQPAAAV